MQANNELLKVPGPNQTDQSAQGNSCSQNDLTSELLQIMDRPPDEADFDSHDLIEDQAGGPLAFSHDCGSLLDADDKILGSTPELPSKSYKKTNSDHPLEEIDGNLSSDAKDILDKLELQPLRHVPRLPADVDDYDICLGDDKSNLEVARTPKKNGFCSGIVNYNGEKASYGLPRLEKYRAMAVPILEESDECISHCQILLSNWITRFKSRLLADLKVCAVSFSCDYNMKVGIVSDTMMMEKAKQTISKLRDVRRCLLRHGLTKLLLFKERHHQQSLFSSRLIESRSNIDQPASGACTFITGDQRKKLVQKIAVNILNNKKIAARELDSLHPFGCREKELSSQADYDCRSTKISNTGKMKVLDTEASPSDDINSSKLDKFKNSGISSIIAINNNNYQGLSAIMSLVKVIRWKRLMGAFLLIRSTPKPSVYKTMIVESLDIDESKYQNKKIELSSPHKRLVLADNSKFAASRLSVKAGDVCLILLDEQQVSDYAKLGARDSWKKSQPESRPKTNGTPAANEAKSPQGSSSNQLQAAASPQNELVEDEPGGAEAAAPSGTAHAHAAGAPLRPN